MPACYSASQTNLLAGGTATVNNQTEIPGTVDQPYVWGRPHAYLSPHERARLLLLRGVRRSSSAAVNKAVMRRAGRHPEILN